MMENFSRIQWGPKTSGRITIYGEFGLVQILTGDAANVFDMVCRAALENIQQKMAEDKKNDEELHQVGDQTSGGVQSEGEGGGDVNAEVREQGDGGGVEGVNADQAASEPGEDAQ